MKPESCYFRTPHPMENSPRATVVYPTAHLVVCGFAVLNLQFAVSKKRKLSEHLAHKTDLESCQKHKRGVGSNWNGEIRQELGDNETLISSIMLKWPRIKSQTKKKHLKRLQNQKCERCCGILQLCQKDFKHLFFYTFLKSAETSVQ